MRLDEIKLKSGHRQDYNRQVANYKGQPRRSTSTPQDKAIIIAQTFSTRFVTENEVPTIFRGNAKVADYLYSDPTKAERTAAFSLPYYNLIMDNSPQWKEFPKRSRSLICTTENSTANYYGQGYAVIPKDDAVFGVCPNSDIQFGTFPLRLNAIVGNLWSSCRNLTDWLGSTEPKSFDQLAELCNKIKQNPDMIRECNHYTNWFTNHANHDLEAFLHDPLQFLTSLASTDGFTIMSAHDVIPARREVWTSSPCLLVNTELYSEFRSLVLNK